MFGRLPTEGMKIAAAGIVQAHRMRSRNIRAPALVATAGGSEEQKGRHLACRPK